MMNNYKLNYVDVIDKILYLWDQLKNENELEIKDIIFDIAKNTTIKTYALLN